MPPLSKEASNRDLNDKFSSVQSASSETNRSARKDAVLATVASFVFPISGKITDEKGEPIIGAAIQVKGTGIGTITDKNGQFSLQAPDGSAVLIISFIGYEKQEVAIGNRARIDIRMGSDTKNLDEVVVVGFGTQKKINATGAISTMTTKELIQSPVANISNSLVGRLTGLFATQSGGEPGNDASKIRIRGIGTFSGNTDPLTLVDGIEVSNYNNIDPNEIESVTILKDASSTAVYGIRGANGVLIITTKGVKRVRQKSAILLIKASIVLQICGK